ncbi:MAG TPA: hypothetical protein VG101_12690 [Puia sp.]|nr:hypothetical protein [Puia sp.]
MAIGEVVLALRDKKGGDWGGGRQRDFYCFLHGLTVGVSVYAVVTAGFATVQTLVVAVYGVWIWMGRAGAGRMGVSGGEWRGAPGGGKWWAVVGSAERRGGPGGRTLRAGGRSWFGSFSRRWREIVVGCLVFVCLFHVLPESEYKQDDSFFYLKMAEAMNRTGQENAHAINNEYGSGFHGVEPYHYFEIWLNAMFLRVTRFCLPGIASFRFIGYAILSVGWMLGLLTAYEQLARKKAGVVAMVFCLSTVFFLPDVVDYWPRLRHYVVYAFDNNYLERPNFRVIYFYLLPLLLSLRGKPDIRDVVLFSVCLCAASYLCCVVLLPAVVLLWAASFVIRGGAAGRGFLWRWAGAVLAMGMVLAIFYGLGRNPGIPSYYSDSPGELVSYLRGHSYFIGTTVVTSLVYVAVVVVVYTGWLWIFRRRDGAAFFQENRLVILVAGAVILVSIVAARVLSFQDNAYQVAFIGYIMASVVVIYGWLYMATFFRTVGFGLLGCLVFTGGYVVRKVWMGPEAFVDITRKNGAVVYGGRPYSAGYLADVGSFVRGKSELRGGYIGDSVYYRQLYYSRRNPNVYFPPLTYIIAGEGGSNYEFCLSDPTDMLTGLAVDPIATGYLDRAIGRSGFYQFEQETRQAVNDRAGALRAFIRDRKLGYLIVTGPSAMAELRGLSVERSFRDESTGETFLILK